MTTTLLLVLLVATDAKGDATVSVDSVTVNGEPQASAKASGAASTASAAGQQWSVVSARTIGSGANSVQGGFGFPGIYAQFLHGLMNNLDLGLRFAFNYGVEGQVECRFPLCGDRLVPGVKVQALGRYKFFDNGKVNAGASFSPGPIFYFDRIFGTQTGFAVPLGATLGIVVSPAMNVAVMLEVPMWIKFGNNSGLAVPILAGAGFEYFITSSLAAFFDLRMGPTIWAGNRLPAVFTFSGNLGVGWRF